jgi:hypothetical protein
MWCTRCNKYHNSLPIDEKKIINNLSQQIADDIDNLVIEELKAITEGASSIRDLKTDRKGDKGVQ